MKLRLARPERLIDIARLGDAQGVRLAAGAAWRSALSRPTRSSWRTKVIGRFGGLRPTRCRGSATSRSAIVARSAGARPRRPRRRPAARAPGAGCRPRHSIGGSWRANDRGRRLLRGRLHDRPRRGRAADRDPPPGAVGRRGSAYQALEQRASGYAIAGVAAVVGRAAVARATARCVARTHARGPRPARGHRRGRPSLPRDGGRGCPRRHERRRRGAGGGARPRHGRRGGRRRHPRRCRVPHRDDPEMRAIELARARLG